VIVALDVHYRTACAQVGCVAFEDWQAPQASRTHTVTVERVADYQSGQFYKRELPCLLTALEEMPDAAATIVIDGYVWLAPERPGLGWHLHQALDGRVAVVGVAKSSFAGNATARPGCRGRSRRPLYVTSCGMKPDAAATAVADMAGPNRIPTMLKLADTLSRTASQEDQ